MTLVLGVESSCDETSVALVNGDGSLVDQIVASQVDVHRPFKGVVPEIAARHHLINLPFLYEELMKRRNLAPSDLGLVSVTKGPGLVAALLVGVAFAKSLSLSSNIPLAGVNHLEGHLFSPFIGREIPSSFMGLVVSGSHASVYLVRPGKIRKLNGTRDDAPGEAFDKVAKLLNLPYPGGPVIDRLSRDGDREAFPFREPRMSDGSMDFSFSGIKSAVSRIVHKEQDDLICDQGLTQRGLDLVASFQEGVVTHLLNRVEALWKKRPLPILAISGGVAANSRLRERFASWGKERGVGLEFPPNDMITDNAAMIAFRGLHLFTEEGAEADPVSLDADPRLGQW